MKKTIYYFLPLLCFGILSCQKEKPANNIPTQEAIEFSSQRQETKGAPLLKNLNDLKTQDFSVSAWYSPEGEAFSSNSTHYISNHRFGTMENGNVTEKTIWRGISFNNDEKMPDPVYYPLDRSLSFFCYAPYCDDDDATVQIINPTSTITDQLINYLPGSPLIIYTPAKEVDSQIDFMAAAPVFDWKKGDGVVPLDFKNHLTSRLEFYCNYTGSINAEEKVYVTGIQINNIIGSEYLYFTKEGDKIDYKWCSDISPDGTKTMPLTSYILSNQGRNPVDWYLVEGEGKNLPKDNGSGDIETNYRYVNGLASGRMYVLPQTFSQYGNDDDNDEGNEVKIPTLDIQYQIRNSQGNIVEDNSLSFDLRESEDWEAGHIVQFKITLGITERRDLKVTTVVINDWDDAGNWPKDKQPEEILY